MFVILIWQFSYFFKCKKYIFEFFFAISAFFKIDIKNFTEPLLLDMTRVSTSYNGFFLGTVLHTVLIWWAVLKGKKSLAAANMLRIQTKPPPPWTKALTMAWVILPCPWDTLNLDLETGAQLKHSGYPDQMRQRMGCSTAQWGHKTQ